MWSLEDQMGNVGEELSFAAYICVEQCQLPHEEAGCFLLLTFMSASNWGQPGHGGGHWRNPTILGALKKCSREDWAESGS